MNYNITNVHKESDMVEFSWENCDGIRVVSVLSDEIDIKGSIQCMRKNHKGTRKGLQYDWNYDTVFYKKQGYHYIAWIKFLNGKWELIKEN